MMIIVSFVKQKHLTFTDLQLVKCEGFDAFSLSYDRLKIFGLSRIKQAIEIFTILYPK